MIDSRKIRSVLAGSRFEVFTDYFIGESEIFLAQRPHGDREKWLQIANNLPEIAVSEIDPGSDFITVRTGAEPDHQITERLRSGLMALCPWRKGPFRIFGVEIDAEWRSCLKWNRIVDQISPLVDRCVLDIGCGNGYYLWRMEGAGVRLAIGIDPTQLFLAQFTAINRYLASNRIFIVPIKCEELFIQGELQSTRGFDTVFSMGIYYHRRHPCAHLTELFRFLRPGGELVLETLVIDGDHDAELVPQHRYAKMRNVWSIPTVTRLQQKLVANGFEEIRLIDITQTTIAEQRRTAWMTFESLADFLDPDDHGRTIEGYPAPKRACMVARRPA